MYKNILLAIIIALFTGCGAPKPPQKPAWFSSPPKDFNLYYAVASASTHAKAKNLAIISLREQLRSDLDLSFKSNTHALNLKQKSKLSQILKVNAHTSKIISVRGVKTQKTAEFKGENLILISVPKKELFDSLSTLADEKFNKAKSKYESMYNRVAIERYATLKNIMLEYPEIASNTQFKANIISTYSPNDEFAFLNTLESDYKKLKKDVSVYILSDGNSLPFIKSVRAAIIKEGLTISKSPVSKDSVKLLVTSKTTDDEEYTFKRSKSLVKFSTYNMEREKIKFKQHTFIGKSKKNHKEAKAQSAIHLKAKIKKEGIFNFIGIHSK